MKQRIAHATVGYAVHAALHQTVRDNWAERTETIGSASIEKNGGARVLLHEITIDGIDVNGRPEGLVVRLGPPVVGRLFGVVPGAKQASPKTNVEGQPGMHPPVVLQIKIGDLVAVVIFHLPTVLGEVFDRAVDDGRRAVVGK